MEKQITVWISAVLLLASLNFSQAQSIPTYFEVGGKLDLRPTVKETITNILWKYNGNLLAEWVKNEVELLYYDKYQNRTTLNIATGQLEINKMKKDDMGLYTVEINNKVHGQSYDVRWITRVPKPIVLFRPLTCGPDSDSCTVICEVEELYRLRDAEPIQYSWKMGEKDWKTMTNDITITSAQTETEPIKTVSCRMKNPVSQEDSDLTVNPMYTEPPPPPTPVGPIVGGMFGVLLLLLAALVGGGIGVWKFKPELLPALMLGGGNDIEATGVKQLGPGHWDPNNSPGAEPNNSPGAEPNSSPGAEPNNSPGAEPKDSSELQPFITPDKVADSPPSTN